MKRWGTRIGAGLMGLVFLVAAQRAWQHGRGDREDGRVTLRIAHGNLHDNMRRAYDQVGRDYEARHPGVRVVFIEVPGRVNDAWQRTQLAGGTPPDVMTLALRMADEEIAAHFRPITAAVGQANPYNVGTALEGVPWRETFMEGLTSQNTFVPNLVDYYGIPTFASTARLFVNEELYARVAPGRPLPRTFDELLAMGALVRAEAERSGRVLMPIAGSEDHGPLLLGQLFAQQTQALALRLGRDRTLAASGAAGGARAAAALLEGEWSVDEGAALNGWKVMREAAGLFQPGFLQANRDGGSFHFLQGEAVGIISGSWDANTLIRLAPFPVTTIPLPLPEAGHPRWGGEVLGPMAEGSGWVNHPFAITARSAHPEVALDFLQFITSAPVQEYYAKWALRVPIIVGVSPAPEVAAFMPQEDGFPGGIAPQFQMFANRGLNMAYLRNLHRLVEPQGGVESFLAAYKGEARAAARADLQRYVNDGFRVLQRGDSAAVAHAWLVQEDAAAEARAEVFWERQHLQEAEYLQHRRTLGEMGQ